MPVNTGSQKREEIQAAPHLASIDYRINRRPKSLPKVSDRAIDWKGIKSINKREIVREQLTEASFNQLQKCSIGLSSGESGGRKSSVR